MNDRARERNLAATAAALLPASMARSGPPVRGGARTLGQDVRQGIAVGSGAGVLIICIVDGSLLMLLLAALACGGVGALVGLLLWVGSAALPEEPVLPPSERPPV